jgi:hypothetical protein
MSTKSHASQIAELTALSTNIPELCPGQSFVLESKTYSVSDIVALVADVLATETNVVRALASYHDAVASCALSHKQNDPILNALRIILTSSFSNSPGRLEMLGLPVPKKRAPLSIEAELGKAAKNRATRVARGTKGKRQKAKIKGEVTGVIITPVIKKPEE